MGRDGRPLSSGEGKNGYVDRSGREVFPCRIASGMISNFLMPESCRVPRRGCLLADRRHSRPFVKFGLFNLQDGGKYARVAGVGVYRAGFCYGIVIIMAL